MINVKNELQYLLVVQTLENAAHEGVFVKQDLQRRATKKYIRQVFHAIAIAGLPQASESGCLVLHFRLRGSAHPGCPIRYNQLPCEIHSPLP